MALTWKREAWPCSRAGLSGATGLRLLQKWIPDSRGLWARSRPEGVWVGATEREREREREGDMGASWAGI